MKAYWGSGGIDPCIPDLSTRQRWVVTFMPRPLYPQGKSPWYPLDRRLAGPQSQSGQGGEEKYFQPLLGLKPPHHPAPSPTLYHWAILAPVDIHISQFNSTRSTAFILTCTLECLVLPPPWCVVWDSTAAVLTWGHSSPGSWWSLEVVGRNTRGKTHGNSPVPRGRKCETNA
jgi:hypothetical protein